MNIFCFFIQNIIFLSLGICVVIFSTVYDWSNFNQFEELHALTINYYNIKMAINALLVSGMLLCLISFFGSWFIMSPMNDSQHFIYVAMLLITMSLELSCMVIGGQYTQSAIDLRLVLKNTLYFYGSKANYTIAWDFFQRKFNCCGVNDYKDWEFITHKSSEHHQVIASSFNYPSSCCFTNASKEIRDYEDNYICNEEEIMELKHEKGCFVPIHNELVIKTAIVISSFSAVLLFVQIMVLIFNYYISKYFTNHDTANK